MTDAEWQKAMAATLRQTTATLRTVEPVWADESVEALSEFITVLFKKCPEIQRRVLAVALPN